VGTGEGFYSLPLREMIVTPFFRKAARLEYDEATGWYETQV